MDIAITGIGVTTGFGDGVQAHADAMEQGRHALRPLAGLLGNDSPYAELLGAWIEDRSVMLSRKWAPASMLSLHVARQAVNDAGLDESDLADAAVIVGSSRGNAAGWVEPWPGRRAFNLMAASNTMHGELASAVSIELGVRGPWQVISSGCAASLDAMGMAWMMLRQGVVSRAIVIGVELPLLSEIISIYQKTGVLATTGVNDPYSPDAGGFFPGEAGAALVMESADAARARCDRTGIDHQSHVTMTGYWCNSDADSPIGMPDDGAGLSELLGGVMDDLPDGISIPAICPHASGTLLHGKAELTAMRSALPGGNNSYSLHPLKPFTGHTVGASGILDCALLAHFMKRGQLPPNLPGITAPGDPFTLEPQRLDAGDHVLKIAVGMGGHNSAVTLATPVNP